MGKTKVSYYFVADLTEHPHLRGENSSSLSSVTLNPGTSPLAWGKRVRGVGVVRRSRNIPTCVGKTFRPWRRPTRITEHPHLRGENLFKSAMVASCAGTSPLAWGKLRFGLWRSRFGRNIPTCVGKTYSPMAKGKHISEHPHLRGENRSTRSRTAISHGTSPLAWGKQRFA